MFVGIYTVMLVLVGGRFKGADLLIYAAVGLAWGRCPARPLARRLGHGHEPDPRLAQPDRRRLLAFALAALVLRRAA
ncbi:MAG: hypothetical protein U1E17_03305 [Geminicoccaceae bacterium]